MAELSAAFYAIPAVTRFLLLGTLLVTFPCLLSVVDPAAYYISWFRVYRYFQIWRPVTCFFFGGHGFPLLYDLFLMYRNSGALEKDVYLNDTAGYAWMHIMLAVFLLLLNIVAHLPFLFRPLLYAQTYLWCRVNPNLKVSVFGLLSVPTSLYPLALIVLDVLTGGPTKALGGVLGLVSGHLWWFLSAYLPFHAPVHLRRPNPLPVPLSFRSLFASTTPADRFSGGTDRSQARFRSVEGNGLPRTATEAVRHRWGTSGQRLGGEGL